MNDALKLLSNSLKPFGYQIRKFRAPNLLRLKAAEKENAAIKTLRNAGHWTTDANLDSMTVFLRTCMRENRNIDPKPRLGSDDLEDATLRCVNSLITAIHAARDMGDICLVVLDDRSDDAPFARLKALLDTAQCDVEIHTTAQTGQGASLHEQFTRGRDENAILYFVEDDYLHEAHAIRAAWDFYRQIARDFETHALLYPQEHHVLHEDLYPSYVLAAPQCHWRSMHHATHTFITHGHILRDFWEYFENTKYVGIKKKRKLGSEARTTNRLFKHIPGFSPIQPLAVHFQFEGLLPPFYDWKALWEKNKIKP
ncbi:MAG: hypothetical protein ACRBCT_05560 [Alphaproteobacteria bacterium]